MSSSLRKILLSVALGAAGHAFGVPAYPGVQRIVMPDGTVRTVIIRGDERCHWLATPDGREIAGTRRVMPPSSYTSYPLPLTSYPLPQTSTPPSRLPLRLERAGGEAEGGFSYLLPLTPNEHSPQSGGDGGGLFHATPGTMLVDGSFPSKGKRKLLALLVNFRDTQPTYPREAIDALLNEEGYGGIGSFRDYYLDQSFGQLDITTTVTPWITVSQSRLYYAENVPALIAEALKKLGPDIRLSDYDNDGDGILDGLIVIHSGKGQEQSGNMADIWSHSSMVYGLQQDGVTMRRYTVEPELFDDRLTSIGVICHEFGHSLGATDFYDTNYASDGSFDGTGEWDLMGGGAWNRHALQGDSPAPFTAWQKWQFGWLTPTQLSATGHYEAPASAAAGECYVMPTTTDGDYFVLENHQPASPWTRELPGHGLLVTHVIEPIVADRLITATVNSKYPQGLYTVCADAGCDPKEGEPQSYGGASSPAAPFPGTRHHTAFHDGTLPSTRTADGRRGYCALTDITESTPDARGVSMVSFDFEAQPAPQRPLDLAATVRGGVVTLTWRYPEGAEQPLYTTVYRQGVAIAQTTALTFTDSEGSTETLVDVEYTLDATYASGEVSATTHVKTRVPRQFARDFAANTTTVDGEEALALTWTVDDELTRCHDNLQYDVIDHLGADCRYAHRFRAEELSLYIGRQIRALTFIPQQTTTEVAYRLCVWRSAAAADGSSAASVPDSELELVASRDVTEYSPTYKRTLAFVKRPTIEAGYDYWIGVEVMSQVNSTIIVTDRSPIAYGYGNMMSLGHTVWQEDPAARGNYILAATLTGATEAESLVLLPPVDDDETLFHWTAYDAGRDLSYPLGFVLRNGERRVAETTGTALTLPLTLLTPEADGTWPLSLVSYYKGDVESRPLTLTVGGDAAGIVPPLTTATAPKIYYDLSGRRCHTMTSGLYISDGRKVLGKTRK